MTRAPRHRFHTVAYGSYAHPLALVNTLAYGKRMKASIDRDTWVSAALLKLRDHGVEAVKVEVLARELGVTKGSFYWHFGDRSALLDAMLERWEREGTLDVITRFDQPVGDDDGEEQDSAARLRRIAAGGFGADTRLERSVRAWAIHDERALAVMARVDRSRIRFIAKLFRQHGLARAASDARARMLYTSYVGEQQIAVPLAAKRRVGSALAALEALLRVE
jgi:AcrR family transcriptional regulator